MKIKSQTYISKTFQNLFKIGNVMDFETFGLGHLSARD